MAKCLEVQPPDAVPGGMWEGPVVFEGTSDALLSRVLCWTLVSCVRGDMEVMTAVNGTQTWKTAWHTGM